MADPNAAEYQEFLAWKASQNEAQNQVAQPANAYAGTPVIATPQDFKKPAGEVTSAKQWKKAKGGVTDLTLPSGNVCKVRRPGMMALLQNGTIPDILGTLVEKSIAQADGTASPEEQTEAQMLSEIMSSEKGRETVFDSAARVMVACVIEPEVLYHRRKKAAGQADQVQESYVPEWEDIPEDERDDEALYADEVDFDDQMFIFQFAVGGSRDLSDFRLPTS